MRVAIIDYGSGNLRSVFKAFARAATDLNKKVEIKLVNHADELALADAVVLPGVGAFADCRCGLDALPGMIDALNEVVFAGGKPFFGICVGMQLMASEGLEKTSTAGLNWIGGEVSSMKPKDPSLKIPQIGWNTLDLIRPHPLFAGIALGERGLHAYFVHSYSFKTTNSRDCIAVTHYGHKVTAAIVRDNMFGTQFHPEKSQKLGLKLIGNFLEWKP